MFSVNAFAQGAWTTFKSTKKVYSMTLQGDYLWCVTDGGIVKHNSQNMTHEKFTTINDTPVNFFTSLYIAPNDVIWCTTIGISRYDGGDKWTTFTTADGLASDNVISVSFAPDGTVWLLTVDGSLSWFDGNKWTTVSKDGGLSIPSFYLTGEILVVDNEGVPWILTNAGVVRYDNGNWTIFTESDGLANKPLLGLFIAPDGAVWCCHQSSYDPENNVSIGVGVSRFADGEWTVFTVSDGLGTNNIGLLSFSPDGYVWALLNPYLLENTGISVYDGESWKVFTTDDGLASDYVESVSFAPDGSVWVNAGGICRYDGEKWTVMIDKYELYDTFDGFENIGDISFTSDGDLWFVCYKEPYGEYYENSTAIFHYDGEMLEMFTYENGLLYNGMPLRITIDSTDRVWCAYGSSFEYDAGGLSWYDGMSWNHYNPDDEPAGNYVWSISSSPEGDIWCITSPMNYTFQYKLSRYNDGKWETINMPEGLSLSSRSNLTIGMDGLLWVGYGNALGCYDGEVWQSYDTQEVVFIQEIAVGSNGDVWCRGYEILSRFYDFGQSGDYTFENFNMRDVLTFNQLFSLTIDNNNEVWVGTDAGIARYDGDSWAVFTTDDGVSGDSVFDLTVDADGDIWALTNTGTPNYLTSISCFDGMGWDVLYQWEQSSGHLSTISIDQYGAAWLGQGLIYGGSINEGVFRYIDESCTQYTMDDGLVNNDVISITINTDGSIWFGTQDGISRLELEPGVYVETKDFVPSKIVITGNYPNPFNPETIIKFDLPHEGMVNLNVYNIMGQKVRKLISDTMTAGTHNIHWDGSDDSGKFVSSGIYFILLKSGSKVTSHRMMLLK